MGGCRDSRLVVVQSQSNRSQHRNKDECFAVLKAKLYDLEIKKKEEAANQFNSVKTDIGWEHQIRSYVLHPYKMVKDLRTRYQKSNPFIMIRNNIDEPIIFLFNVLIKLPYISRGNYNLAKESYKLYCTWLA
jgi:peptide chain release factor 2